jgi:hypothetical protein
VRVAYTSFRVDVGTSQTGHLDGTAVTRSFVHVIVCGLNLSLILPMNFLACFEIMHGLRCVIISM